MQIQDTPKDESSQLPHILEAALEYNRLDLVTTPSAPNAKRPAKGECWKPLQYRLPTPNEVRDRFNRHPETTGICLIAGVGSGNLAVLDCDNRAALDEAADRLNVDTWIVSREFEDGDPHYGGGHIHVRTDQPIATAKRGKIDIKAQGGYVLAPPSLHKSGAVYATVSGAPDRIAHVTLSDLEWLNVEAANVDATALALEAQRPKYFPRQAWQMLHGAGVDRYPSRSEHEQAIMSALIVNHFDFAGIFDAFNRWAYAGSRFRVEQDKGGRHAIEWLERSYRAAAEHVISNPSAVTTTITELRAHALMTSWPGMAGATDRAVYYAHLSIAERAQNVVYGASVRELAELAGVNKETVSAANRRLIDGRGLLERAERDEHQAAFSYRLIPVWSESVQSSNFSNVSDCTDSDQNHDLWRRGAGLGKVAGEVWAALKNDDLSESEVVSAIHRPRRTVDRALAALFKCDMITPVLGKWHALSVDLDDVAREVGCFGIGERQRQKHIEQRNAARLELARQRAEVTR